MRAKEKNRGGGAEALGEQRNRERLQMQGDPGDRPCGIPLQRHVLLRVSLCCRASSLARGRRSSVPAIADFPIAATALPFGRSLNFVEAVCSGWPVRDALAALACVHAHTVRRMDRHGMCRSRAQRSYPKPPLLNTRPHCRGGGASRRRGIHSSCGPLYRASANAISAPDVGCDHRGKPASKKNFKKICPTFLQMPDSIL